MKARAADLNYGLLVHLIWLPVIFSVPIIEFDIWGDRDREETVGGERNLSGSDLSRLPRVLNFFPVPFVEECKANDGRRRGICMNTYECRIEGGKSHGFCALGFGVCCVFTATCEQEVINNLTYFVNPDFPDLSKDMSACSLNVKKIDPEVSQIRFDFIHFNLGQPNRRTGVCEEDIFLISAENLTREVTICGFNSGQHEIHYFSAEGEESMIRSMGDLLLPVQVYIDVENVEEIGIRMTLSKKAVSRFWEVIITQIPFTERSPPECLQYFTGRSGIVQTMNFADNGRHLANQDYNICVRQEEGMCGITYEPCHENAFRIAPNTEDDDTNTYDSEEGSGDIDSRVSFRALEMCRDKIVLPCDSDELLLPEMLGIGPGLCSLVHCGPKLCPSGNSPCRIESSATPFNIGVHFGQNAGEASPEDNLGMCLNYKQIPCGE